MKKMKLFPKTFFYTLGLMLFIVGIAHLLLYLFTKPEWLVISVSPHDELSLHTSLNVTDYVTQTVLRALPLSLICCVIISIYLQPVLLSGGCRQCLKTRKTYPTPLYTSSHLLRSHNL